MKKSDFTKPRFKVYRAIIFAVNGTAVIIWSGNTRRIVNVAAKNAFFARYNEGGYHLQVFRDKSLWKARAHVSPCRFSLRFIFLWLFYRLGVFEMTDKNFTPDYVQYCVSFNVKHLFTTDARRMGYDINDELEHFLVMKFPAFEGFDIERRVSPNRTSFEKVEN